MGLKEILAAKRAQWDKRDSLLAAVTAATIKGYVDFDSFRILTEWLEVYTYIPTADRSVSFDMMAFLTKGVAKAEESVRARKIFKAWLLADLVETALTERQQAVTLRYLNRKEGE